MADDGSAQFYQDKRDFATQMSQARVAAAIDSKLSNESLGESLFNCPDHAGQRLIRTATVLRCPVDYTAFNVDGLSLVRYKPLADPHGLDWDS